MIEWWCALLTTLQRPRSIQLSARQAALLPSLNPSGVSLRRILISFAILSPKLRQGCTSTGFEDHVFTPLHPPDTLRGGSLPAQHQHTLHPGARYPILVVMAG